ncbi:hypothetical protein NL676_035204 [Syzygium grande]|nr:hypothetical protein NL676_035204 [Syzygium grande]
MCSRFIFETKQRVLISGPRSIIGNYINLQRWDAQRRVEDLYFDEPEVWLQIHGLAFDQMTENNAKAIAPLAGKVDACRGSLNIASISGRQSSGGSLDLHRPDQDSESIALSLSPSHTQNVVPSQAPIILPRLLFCSFHDGHAAICYEAASGCDNSNCYKAARSPRSWLLSTAQELPLPKIRYKCRRIIMWIGRCRRQGHVAAIEFGYDPMSYALNFEDDWSRELDKEFPARNFSARLPVSLDRLLLVKLPREVVACS